MTQDADDHGKGSKVRSARRLGVMAQWSRDSDIPPHVRIHLAGLRPHCSRLILVSNSPLRPEARSEAQALSDQVIERPNRGYDFAAWRSALLSEDTAGFDEVLLTNSSVIGPLFPLDRAFESMQARPCDFWAMTGSHSITPHLQSYFLVFRASVTRSPAWMDYWTSIREIENKKRLIRTYEINLMRHFEAHGFLSDTYAPRLTTPARRWMFRRLNVALPIWLPFDGSRADPTIFFPYEIIQMGVPYLKASLVWTHHRRQGCPIAKIKAHPDVEYPWHEIGL